MSFLRHNVPDLLQPVVHLPDGLEAIVLGRLLDRRTRPCHALIELGHDRVEAGDGWIDQRPVFLNPLEDLLLALIVLTPARLEIPRKNKKRQTGRTSHCICKVDSQVINVEAL